MTRRNFFSFIGRVLALACVAPSTLLPKKAEAETDVPLPNGEIGKWHQSGLVTYLQYYRVCVDAAGRPYRYLGDLPDGARDVIGVHDEHLRLKRQWWIIKRVTPGKPLVADMTEVEKWKRMWMREPSCIFVTMTPLAFYRTSFRVHELKWSKLSNEKSWAIE